MQIQINSKKENLHHVKSVIIFGQMVVVTWQKKKQAAASPDLSPKDFGFWNLIDAKLRGNRASDMDAELGHLSCCDTAQFRRRMAHGGLSHSHVFTTAPSQRGQPLRGPSVLTGRSFLLLEQPTPKSAMSDQLASNDVDTVWLLHSAHSANVISQKNTNFR